MEKGNHKRLCSGIILLVSFVLWTAAVCFVDVKAIGPGGSTVGFAAINGFVHAVTGVHMRLYSVTDWLGLVPITFALGFGVFGLAQWIRRGRIKSVDRDILLLGGFYAAVMAVYILFEYVVINYRPVLIAGIREASYPSSTTMLVMCVMPTAAMQFNSRIKNLVIKRGISLLIAVFVVFMVIGRLVSGVHWFTDIVGGVILSGGLVLLYRFFSGLE